MHLFIKLLISIVLMNFVECNDNCRDACPKTVLKHYYELGCEPIYDIVGDSKCCPSRFNCPDFTALNQDKCHYGGVTYDLDAELPRKSLPDCMNSCKCTNFGSLARFICTILPCPEATVKYDSECIFQKNLDECCSVNIICDQQKIADLNQCYLDGLSYREGEIVYPWNDQCYSCICNKKFDNMTDLVTNKNCKKNEFCHIELYRLNKFQKGCAPVYYGEKPCCPSSWRCPNDNDEMIKGGQKNVNGPTCKFGSLIFELSDRLKDDCVDCICQTPPLLTCTQTKEC